MKLEELTQDKLDDLLESLNAVTESQKGLKADLAKAKAKAKGADIDPEQHAALQTQVEELTDKLAKSEKAHKTDTDKLTSSLSEKDGALHKYLVEAQLTDALAKAGVKPEFMDASKALLKTQATIKADGGDYQALIGDKALADYVKEWSSGEQGKHFVAAAANNGGGAQGGSGNGTGKSIKQSDFDTLAPKDRAAKMAEGYMVVE